MSSRCEDEAVVAFEVAAVCVVAVSAALTLQAAVVMAVAEVTAMVVAMPDAIGLAQRSEQPPALPLTALTALTAPTTTPISAAITPIRRARNIDRPNNRIGRVERFANQTPRRFAGGPFCIHCGPRLVTR